MRIVAAEASRQSTGLRCWCGESPITIVVAEKRFTCPISADTARTAVVGCGSSAQLAASSVTCGWSFAARASAQRYQTVQPQSVVCSHLVGTQPTFTNGTTSQPSRRAILRIVGIHICACESPITAIVFAAPGAPRWQTVLEVWPRPAAHPAGKA